MIYRKWEALCRRRRALWRRAALPVLLAAVCYSCASIGRIEGGPLDETPPRFLGSSPRPGALQVKRGRVSIEFDEYIKLDKPGEKIVISPPQKQQPEIKASGKRVIVRLEDTLKAATTYTVDFADAIQDNNEGNPLEQFTFTFSTGSVLDTMAVGGTVLNASNLEPVKGMLVGLYANLADTAFTTQPFERVGRTDSRGHFSIRGIAPGKYRLFALSDADQNYYFSQPTENVAFYDSIVVPTMEERVRQDTFWLDSLTMDTIIDQRYTHYLPDDLLLRSFKEKYYRQRLAKTERLTPQKFSLYFTAPMDSLPRLRGLNFDERGAFENEYPTGRIDTIHYWIRDSLVYKLDTLEMELNYLASDSLNRLVPQTDTLRVLAKQTYEKMRKQKQEADEKKLEEMRKQAKKKRKKDEDGNVIEPPEPVLPTEFLSVEVYAPSSMDVYDYLSLTFQEPVASMDSSAFRVQHKVDTLWVDIPFDLARDSSQLRVYNVFADWEFGEGYRFEVDSTAICGLYGLFTDKISSEFTVKKEEDYGQIFFDVSGTDTVPVFVELLDASDKVLRTVPLTEGRADFYYLNPGKYGARLVEDANGNGVWDTGDYKAGRQPERVYYYPQVLELKANFELNQTWDIHGLPLDRQKPDELKKQKPDENKKKRDTRKYTNPDGTRNSGRGYSY